MAAAVEIRPSLEPEDRVNGAYGPAGGLLTVRKGKQGTREEVSLARSLLGASCQK